MGATGTANLVRGPVERSVLGVGGFDVSGRCASDLPSASTRLALSAKRDSQLQLSTGGCSTDPYDTGGQATALEERVIGRADFRWTAESPRTPVCAREPREEVCETDFLIVTKGRHTAHIASSGTLVCKHTIS